MCKTPGLQREHQKATFQLTDIISKKCQKISSLPPLFPRISLTPAGVLFHLELGMFNRSSPPTTARFVAFGLAARMVLHQLYNG